MRRSKRQKQELNKRRYEAIKSLMSTFAMSTVAVVAVVTFIPASPKAEILRSVELVDEIAYQVNVTDADNALDLSTLFVVLENQSEYYEQSIGLGENSGFFDGLLSDTNYKLSIYGSKGFGQERLATMTVTTKEKPGGVIYSVEPYMTEFSRGYFVNFKLSDPLLEYSSFNLVYGYSTEFDAELTYYSIPITLTDNRIELIDIFTHEPIHIYLEGVKGIQTEVIDEIWVTPPFVLHASVYPDSFSNSSIGFYMYGDEAVEHITFTMKVYKEEQLIRTASMDLQSHGHESSSLLIDKLAQNTTYSFICEAEFKNPITLRTETRIVYEQQLTTLDDYDIDYRITKVEGFYDVNIVMNDPNDYFQTAYFETYQLGEEYPIYLDGWSYPFIIDGNKKTVTFQIPIPEVNNYEINIGIQSDYDYMIRQTLKTIK